MHINMMIIFFKKYFEWRLFQHDSPLTFFAYDNSFKNVVTFSIGLRGHIPFLRIVSVIKDNEETFEGLLKSTEIFASKEIGIPVILYSITEDIPPPKILNIVNIKICKFICLFK